jgi:SnoaL-like domain
MTAEERDDKLAIREVIENWVIWRDSGQWDLFKTVWHEGARMHATWFQGSFEDFIANARQSWGRGGVSCHFLGGTSIRLKGSRAIAQTKMKIDTRGKAEDVLCDIVCTGRFYDFLEKRAGRWAILLRQPIYEKDRLDAVDPAAAPRLDPQLLGSFPEGYRHLAYVQAKAGFPVKRDMPGLHGPEVERLYAAGAKFLDGGPAVYA